MLTRSAYGPVWSRAANQRRLKLLAGIAARSLAAQTTHDWTWIVALDPADELRVERERALVTAGVPVVMLDAPQGDDPERAALAAYRAPWAQAMGLPRDEPVLMTRLDDDDGLAPDALRQVQQAATALGADTRRVAFVFPRGIRVWRGQYSVVVHRTNAMASLRIPPGDTGTVYDYGHRRVEQAVDEVVYLNRTGWLWSRHADTLSGWKLDGRPLTPRVRHLFPVDWSLV